MITKQHMLALADMYNSMVIQCEAKIDALLAYINARTSDAHMPVAEAMLEQLVGSRNALDHLIQSEMPCLLGDFNERFDIDRWIEACYLNSKYDFFLTAPEMPAHRPDVEDVLAFFEALTHEQRLIIQGTISEWAMDSENWDM